MLILVKGYSISCFPVIKLLLYKIVTYKIKIDITNPITPPNLLHVKLNMQIESIIQV